MMGGSQGFHPPYSVPNTDPLPCPSPNQCFDISPDRFNRELNFSNILRIGTLNVRSIVHSFKQLNLFSLLIFHQLHGLILTETNLRSPTHKLVVRSVDDLSGYLYGYTYIWIVDIFGYVMIVTNKLICS
ncbi:unnamed protein product [Rhizophagus irregularis]|nr:unnamed protein product [Rhizophagus irregularis]